MLLQRRGPIPLQIDIKGARAFDAIGYAVYFLIENGFGDGEPDADLRDRAEDFLKQVFKVFEGAKRSKRGFVREYNRRVALRDANDHLDDVKATVTSLLAQIRHKPALTRDTGWVKDAVAAINKAAGTPMPATGGRPVNEGDLELASKKKSLSRAYDLLSVVHGVSVQDLKSGRPRVRIRSAD